MIYIIKYKDISNLIIKKFAILPNRYNGDLNLLYKVLDNIEKEYPKYYNSQLF